MKTGVHKTFCFLYTLGLLVHSLWEIEHLRQGKRSSSWNSGVYQVGIIKYNCCFYFIFWQDGTLTFYLVVLSSRLCHHHHLASFVHKQKHFTVLPFSKKDKEKVSKKLHIFLRRKIRFRLQVKCSVASGERNEFGSDLCCDATWSKRREYLCACFQFCPFSFVQACMTLERLHKEIFKNL